MHRACTPERNESEVARLDALLDGQRPDRLGHLRVDDRHDPFGQLGNAEPELLSEDGDRIICGARVKGHPAGGEGVGVDSAEHEVRVGHGGTRPPAAVTGRTRIGPRALGPDAQPSDLGVGNRTATGADRVDVRDRHQEREALE